MNIDLVKQYLKDVIELEAKKIIAEETLNALVIEEKQWKKSMEYVPRKKKSNISFLDMLITCVRTFVISSVVWIILLFVLGNIEGTLLNILLALIFVISVYILPVAIPIYTKIKDVYDINIDYKKQKEKEKNIKIQSDKSIYIINNNKDKLRETYKYIVKNLDKLYSSNIIYKKYQSIEACAAILEYLESGRCYELEGPYGAYNKFDTEAAFGKVITELKTISSKMDVIIQNQRHLELVVRNIGNTVNEMKEDIRRICNSTQNIEKNVTEIVDNTKITAWSSAVMATQISEWQSEAMRKVSSIS